jgi:hypothetical protein
MLVPLTWREVRQAALAGIDRNIYAHDRRLRDRERVPDEIATPHTGWQVHVVGMLGECAVAKALNQYWPREFDAGDVSLLQVRSTTYTDGHLIVYDYNPDDAAFILVTGAAPNLRISGWIEGRAAKQRKWWHEKERGSAFFVPQMALQPVEALIEDRLTRR